MDPERAARATEAGQQGGITYVSRTQAGVAAFFNGLDLHDPGVGPLQLWRPAGGPGASPAGPTAYAAVGRKP